MNIRKLLAPILFAAAGLVAVAGSIAIAQPAKDAAADAKPSAMSESSAAPDAAPAMPLPPGWTEADMMACMTAATPGLMHKRLTADVGEWTGKATMWMFPGAEPTTGDCAMKAEAIMDGRYVKFAYESVSPALGPFTGLGINGFDNVSGKFVSIWLDSWSTGVMTGTGELSEDTKTITWNSTYNCPITKKPATMRQIETTTSPNTKTLDMFGPDPKTGKEFQMIRIELTRKPMTAGAK